MFLVPDSLLSGWLWRVGGAPEAFSAGAGWSLAEIAHCRASRASFRPTRELPRRSAPPGWLACGPAAMAFDPICGDGTAHAIREAILASAVIRALANGGAADGLLSHYQARLTAGFRRHLILCRHFTNPAARLRYGRAELDAIDRGIQWCDAKLDRITPVSAISCEASNWKRSAELLRRRRRARLPWRSRWRRRS